MAIVDPPRGQEGGECANDNVSKLDYLYPQQQEVHHPVVRALAQQQHIHGVPPRHSQSASQILENARSLHRGNEQS